MTADRSHKVADEPAAAGRQRPERKKRKWDQPAEDLVSAAVKAAAVAGIPVMNFGALPGVTAYGAATLPSVVPVPYSLPPHIAPSVPPRIAPSVLQNAAVAVQKLSQAKIPDEVIAREIVINDADPSVRYKLTKRQTQEEIQRCTNTVIITRGKYHPPNEHPDGEKPLYLHISAGSQLKDTAERIKAVDRAASMIEEILKQGTISESISVPFSSSGGQAVRPFSASIFLDFDADPSLNIAARIRGPNDQYINHIMGETGVTVVLRGKGSENLGSCHGEASQQPLHLYLASMHLKNLEAAKVLADNLLDTIAAEFGASRISCSNVYGAVPPPQQLLAGTDTSGAKSDVHYTLGPNVLSRAPHSSASTAVIAPVVAPAVAVQSGAPTYSGVPPPSNMAYPIPPVNGGAFYSGYGDIYPQATPLQQVAFTLKHALSSAAQAVPVTSTPTIMATKENSTWDVEMDKRSRRKFQELPVSKGPATESQNSQLGSKFVKTGLDSLGNIGSSSIAPPKIVHPGSNGMLLPEEADMSSHLSISTKMPPPPLKSMLPPPPKNMPPPPPPPPPKSMPPPSPPKSMLPPPSKSMPPPPPKFPSDELLSRNENKTFALKELTAPPRPLDARSVLPSQRQPKEPEEQTKATPVSDTLLKLIDYGDDDDDDDIDVTDNIPKGNPTPGSEQKPF
ncbi:protein RIK-like [Miscanthus floridulus]|uniref:protein RIK-like n=1 Tax=Miscanthus floridulus TaxID=154761 RepID=UPI0034598BCF